MRSPLRILLASVCLALAGCTDQPTQLEPAPIPAVTLPTARLNNYSRVSAALLAGGAYAENSFMACVHSYVAQGLPLQQIYVLCSVVLDSQAAVGWGPSSGAFTFPSKTPNGFDAAALASVCKAGDPRLAGGYQPLGQGRYFAEDQRHKINEDFGSYTWGGKGKPTGIPGTYYKGLTQAESEKIKDEAVDEAMDAAVEAADARKAVDADPKNADKQRIAAEKQRIFEQKRDRARQDPNLEELVAGDANGGAGTAREAGAAACANVMTAARELLAECHRTGGKAFQCQQLYASVKGCPDPALIYVDPNAGYACAPTVDPQLVIDAWRQKCEQNTTPGPDGGSPCSKPNPSESGRTMSGNEEDLCRNVYARTDPEHDGCIAPLEVSSFGRPDVGGLIVWGQGVLGGPIFVLPLPKPPIVIKGQNWP